MITFVLWMVSLVRIFLGVFLLQRIDAKQLRCYESPGGDLYLVHGQNVRLEWLYSPIGNTKVEVLVDKQDDSAEYCGTNPPTTGLYCENSTGQVVLSKSCIQKDIAGDYEVAITNGHQVREFFHINVLEIQVDVTNRNNHIYSFPRECLTPGEDDKSHNTLTLRPLEVKVGEEYKYDIKTSADNINFIACFKRINGKQKSNSLIATPSASLEYHVPFLVSELRDDVVVVCHVVTDNTTIYLRQQLVENGRSTTEIGSPDVNDGNPQSPGFSCKWGIPLIIVILIIILISTNTPILRKFSRRCRKDSRMAQNKQNSTELDGITNDESDEMSPLHKKDDKNEHNKSHTRTSEKDANPVAQKSSLMKIEEHPEQPTTGTPDGISATTPKRKSRIRTISNSSMDEIV